MLWVRFLLDPAQHSYTQYMPPLCCYREHAGKYIFRSTNLIHALCCPLYSVYLMVCCIPHAKFKCIYSAWSALTVIFAPQK